MPAARDILIHADPIPRSTLLTSHPPLVTTYLALWWKLSGYTPAVTRTAMLLLAAFALAGVFRLARSVANAQVAAAATVCTALYPVFFSQSTLAHLDLAAAAFTLWALAFYVEERTGWAALAFSLAALAKETAVITPLALLGLEVLLVVVTGESVFRRASGMWGFGVAVRDRKGRESASEFRSFIANKWRQPAWIRTAWLLAPLLPLAGWYIYQGARTGHPFGEPEYFRYNLTATLHPLRFLITVFKRLWQVLGYMHLFLLTIGAALAMRLPPQLNRAGEEKPRISVPVQLTFAVIVAAHVVAFAVLGGAVLARYILPAVPLVIIVCVSTLWRRVRQWRLAVAIVCAGFLLALFINPPYPFTFEDNLAYRDFVHLHRSAAGVISQRYARSRVLTAWPATDELSKPYLGYVKTAVPIVPMENFSAERVLAVARDPSLYDVALLFSTKYEPSTDLTRLVPGWQWLEQRFFHFHRDLPPELAAQMLNGRLVFQERRGGLWVAIAEIERTQNASLR